MPQNSGQQLFPCLRDALRQYFPQQTVKGNGTYSPIDDARFKAGIPTLIAEAAKHTPGAVIPDAVSLGIYDIYYDSNNVNTNGGTLHSLETVIEEELSSKVVCEGMKEVGILDEFFAEPSTLLLRRNTPWEKIIERGKRIQPSLNTAIREWR